MDNKKCDFCPRTLPSDMVWDVSGTTLEKDGKVWACSVCRVDWFQRGIISPVDLITQLEQKAGSP